MVCERLHQTVANVLRTTIAQHPPRNRDQATAAIDYALSTNIHITRCTTSRSLGISPGTLVFCREMFLDLPIIVDLLQIQQNRHVLIGENLRRQNKRRKDFNYSAGQEVLVKTVNPSGPYGIQQVYNNSTIDIMRRENVVERINIRRVIPFRR